MGRVSKDLEPYQFTTTSLILIGFVVCLVVYGTVSPFVTPKTKVSQNQQGGAISLGSSIESLDDQSRSQCCKGIEHQELWGEVVRSGYELKVNTSTQCCHACKDTCNQHGHCTCNSWVFCGDKDACKLQFGECWLKKQGDKLIPLVVKSGSSVKWTSGIIYGRGEGIVGIETKLGTIHIQLLPECAPRSIEYILHLLKLKNCRNCVIYRAEHRGKFWDDEGNHINNTGFGPPYALIQGSLDGDGSPPEIPKENLQSIGKGSIAWVDSGPDFFISLASHDEWTGKYTVFGTVMPEDMWIAEKIALLPTKSENWNKVEVSVLQNPVAISIQRKKIE